MATSSVKSPVCLSTCERKWSGPAVLWSVLARLDMVTMARPSSPASPATISSWL